MTRPTRTMTIPADVVIRHDTRVIEISCAHGVGHPSRGLTTLVSTQRADGRTVPWVWSTASGVHGCDGCCREDKWWAREAEIHDLFVVGRREHVWGDDNAQD